MGSLVSIDLRVAGSDRHYTTECNAPSRVNPPAKQPRLPSLTTVPAARMHPLPNDNKIIGHRPGTPHFSYVSLPQLPRTRRMNHCMSDCGRFAVDFRPNGPSAGGRGRKGGGHRPRPMTAEPLGTCYGTASEPGTRAVGGQVYAWTFMWRCRHTHTKRGRGR